MKQLITKIVDAFYFPIVRQFIPLQTFRYGVCGGINLLLDAVLYALLFNFVLHKKDLNLSFVVISPQIAAFLIVFPITFIIGFWLAKNVSFEGRKGKSSTQSIKYLIVVLINIATKYWGLKILTLNFSVFPSIANVIMTIVTVVISYILQNKFTFKKS